MFTTFILPNAKAVGPVTEICVKPVFVLKGHGLWNIDSLADRG